MDIYVIVLILLLVGSCMGSFAGAQVWRLRAKQVVQEKNEHEKYDEIDYKKLNKLTKNDLLHDHSICLNCSYKLCWYDLIPIFSWLSLRGKCRKCHKSIGYMEIIAEVSMATFFVLSYAFWPFPLDNWLMITRLALWLVSGVCLATLFIYDFKWSLLPYKLNVFVIILGIINSVIVVIQSADKIESLISIIIAVLILSGIYWVLDKISNGRWIGGGDIILGFGLALMLADWKLAYLALLSANLIGCIILAPSLITNKFNLKSHIPFGPLFIAGFVLSGLFGSYIVNLYFSFLL